MMILTMGKFVGIFVGLIMIVHCQSWNETGEDLFISMINENVYVTDTMGNATDIIPPKPFVYYGRYHHRRFSRQAPSKNPPPDLDTVTTILSILPLDRLGAIIGQIMATGLKEMLNPNVGKKIINVIENQGPSLLTTLFTNLYSTLRVPVRTSTNTSTASINKTGNKQLSNSSSFSFTNSIRRPRIN